MSMALHFDKVYSRNIHKDVEAKSKQKNSRKIPLFASGKSWEVCSRESKREILVPELDHKESNLELLKKKKLDHQKHHEVHVADMVDYHLRLWV